MEQPISIHLPDDVKANIKRLRFQAGLCQYRVPHSVCELIPLPGAAMVRQQFHHVGFYMQLLEINVSNDITIPFSVLYPATFLTFMLKGTITFYDDRGNQISQALGGTFYLSYNGIVTYEARLKQGLNQLLIVTIAKNELLPAKADFPKFAELLEHLSTQRKEPIILPYCHIGQTIWKYLNRIFYYTADNAIERGAGILVLLTRCMGFYHKLLENNHYIITHLEEADASRLKEFLLNHYQSEAVNRILTIAEALQLTSWQVRKLSKKFLGKSVHQLVIDLRMKKAAALLKGTMKSIRDISLLVGYDNEAYFSTAFTKYYRVSPISFRRIK